MTENTPKAGALVQDTLGHWYRVMEVRANGWRFLVESVTETPKGFLSNGYRAIEMGRSEFKHSQNW